jgi:isopentenyl phosphate kinase
MIVCKIGGSILYPEKSKSLEGIPNLDKKALSRLAEPLLEVNEPILLVCGLGKDTHDQFHYLGITSKAERSVDPLKLINLHRRCLLQSIKVTTTLARIGLPVVQIDPFSCSFQYTEKDDWKRVYFPSHCVLKHLLELGKVPLLHGGIVVQPQHNIAGISSDCVVAKLAVILKANLLLCLTNVDGVMIPDIENGELKQQFPTSAWNEISSYKDMGKKVRRLSTAVTANVPCYIVNGYHPERIRLLIKHKDAIATKLSL